MQWRATICLAAMSCMLFGCAHESAPHDRPKYAFALAKMTLETVPSGADVYQITSIDQQQVFLGKTPLREQTVSVLSQAEFKGLTQQEYMRLASRGGGVEVVILKPGYERYTGVLPVDRQKTLTHQIDLIPLKQTPAKH